MSTPPPHSPAIRTPMIGSNSNRNSIVTDSPSRKGSASPKDTSSISDDDEAEQEADLPLTMAASVVLAQLPKDAKTALERVAAGGVMGGGQGAVADRGILHLCYFIFVVFPVPCLCVMIPLDIQSILNTHNHDSRNKPCFNLLSTLHLSKTPSNKFPISNSIIPSHSISTTPKNRKHKVQSQLRPTFLNSNPLPPKENWPPGRKGKHLLLYQSVLCAGLG